MLKHAIVSPAQAVAGASTLGAKVLVPVHDAHGHDPLSALFRTTGTASDAIALAGPAAGRSRPAHGRALGGGAMSVFLHGTVAEIEQITARMRRIRITGPGLRDLPWTPGTHIRLRVGDLRSPRSWLRGLLRTYSIWDYSAGRPPRPVHTRPPVRRARSAVVAAGTRRRPGGPHLAGRPASSSARTRAITCSCGDETATVAFGAMLRALPPSAIVHGAISVEGPGDHLPLNHADRLTWSCRPADRVDPAHLVDPGHLVDPTHLVDPAHLVDMVRSLELPDAPGVAYLAGEARSCQAVRLHLIRERGWPRRAVVVKPFWTPGRRGMD